LRFAVLPEGYQSWTFDGGFAVAREDVRAAVELALATSATLHRWAERVAGAEVFTGRGAAYGVSLGPVRAVVRHARRGGLARLLSDDWFLGSPRFLRELAVGVELARSGVSTPAFLAGAAYAAGLGYRADVATERVEGTDLADLLFGPAPPVGERRRAVMEAVGRLTRRLHQAGYVHPDLQLKNVLVSQGPSGVAAYLLDVDTCRRASGEAEQRANLARLYRSWEKWSRNRDAASAAEDRERFEAAYRAGAE
jgi:3-deoxy-D-manno-octulosonic acid kinase